MIDIDYAPGVFAMWILLVVVAPAVYGLFVDTKWKENKENISDEDADAFN